MLDFVKLILFMYGLQLSLVVAMYEVDRITDLDEAARTEQQLLIYHPRTEIYLFVSNDESKRDNIVEGHPYQYETRNVFKIQKVGENAYRFLNVDYKRWLFVSNDRKGNNHVLEAHPYAMEKRNEFRFIKAPHQPDGHYLIVNIQYGLTLFVSKDTKQQDRIVEASKLDVDNQYLIGSTNIEKYVFVLQGIKGIMGSQNDMLDLNAHDGQSGVHWLFTVVVITTIGSCLAVVIKKVCGEEDKLSKFR